MTEYQKMLGGQLYNAQDGELQAMHQTAMELCHALNQLNPNQKEEARALLRQLLGRTGEHFTIKSTFWCDYGRHITIGENFFCNYNCVMLDCAPITFGDNVMVAPNCGFYTAAHPLDHTLRDEELEYAKPITVGDSVWIGGGSARRHHRQPRRHRRGQRGGPRHSRGGCGRRQPLPSHPHPLNAKKELRLGAHTVRKLTPAKRSCFSAGVALY